MSRHGNRRHGLDLGRVDPRDLADGVPQTCRIQHPAIPITRSFGNPDACAARNVISSSGFETTMMIASVTGTTWLMTLVMMAALLPRRSPRLCRAAAGSPP